MHLNELHALSVVEVGSTMWRMNHADSDVDYFALWSAHPVSLLNGTHDESLKKHRTKMVSHEYPGSDEPVMEATEASHQIKLLLDGNINAIQRTLSPIRHVWTRPALDLERIVRANPAKNIFHSVNGMNTANLKRYERRAEESKEFGEKKAGQIYRVVRTAIDVLDGNGYHFNPVWGASFDDCVNVLDELREAYDGSLLPERPDEQPFRDWLLHVRMSELSDTKVFHNYR